MVRYSFAMMMLKVDVVLVRVTPLRTEKKFVKGEKNTRRREKERNNSTKKSASIEALFSRDFFPIKSRPILL